MPGSRSTAPPFRGTFPFELSRLPVSRGSALLEFLRGVKSFDRVVDWDDFTEDTLAAITDRFDVAAGATATTWALTAVEDGALLGVTGTTAATSGLQLYTPALFTGARNAEAWIRVKTSDITELRLEFGLVDALPSVNTPCVNSLTTPTFSTVADGALYVYNHTGSTTTTGLYAIDSTASTGDAEKSATTTRRLVNDTYQIIGVKLIGGTAHLVVDGEYLTSIASAVKSTTALRAALSIKNNSTTSQDITVDLFARMKDRNR